MVFAGRALQMETGVVGHGFLRCVSTWLCYNSKLTPPGGSRLPWAVCHRSAKTPLETYFCEISMWRLVCLHILFRQVSPEFPLSWVAYCKISMRQIQRVYIRTRDTLTNSKYGCLHCRNPYGLIETTPVAASNQKSRVAIGLQWLVCLPFINDKS